MHQKQIVYKGKSLGEAEKALILLHGRGATANDILTLSDHLNVGDFAILAPQAANHTWYPYSFLVPTVQNEPWLSSAIVLLDEIRNEINKAGIPDEKIFVAGFSQGACLTLEYTSINARRWGGIVAFTGGLIGDIVAADRYSGDFNNTPIFIGSSNPDPHVPAERVKETAALLKSMNADVTTKLYPNLGHTISEDELLLANSIIFNR